MVSWISRCRVVHDTLFSSASVAIRKSANAGKLTMRQASHSDAGQQQQRQRVLHGRQQRQRLVRPVPSTASAAPPSAARLASGSSRGLVELVAHDRLARSCVASRRRRDVFAVLSFTSRIA